MQEKLLNICALASLKAFCNKLTLKAFCNKLMIGQTQNDTNIRKLILLHKNGEEPCTS